MMRRSACLLLACLVACSRTEAASSSPLTVGAVWHGVDGCAQKHAADTTATGAALVTIVSAADCYYCRDHLMAFEGEQHVADALGHHISLYAPPGRVVEATASLLRQARRPLCVDTSGALIRSGAAGTTPVTALVVRGRIVGVWRGGFERPQARQRFWREVNALSDPR
mgnify:CR=1 FL=1